MRNLIFLLLASSVSACSEFRMSEEEMKSYLEQHRQELKSDTISMDGQKIHFVYSDNDRQDLLVFVHGSPGSWDDFAGYMTTDSILARYDVLSIDRPGFGYSDFGSAEPSMEKQAFLLSEIIKKFKHKHKILIGHSLGGPVIARVAMDHPEIVDGLLFLASSIDPEMEKFEWYRSLGKTWVGDLLVPTAMWVSNEEIVPLKKELEMMLPLWENIQVPCVVVHGTKDMLVPVENADFAKDMIADSLISVVYLEGVNHFIPWTNATDIMQALENLVESVYSSRS